MTIVLGGPIIVLTLLRHAHSAGQRARPRRHSGGARRCSGWPGSRSPCATRSTSCAGESRVYVCNHISWWEIFALASVLPRLPLRREGRDRRRSRSSAPAANAVAAIFIDRKNRRTAFAAYEDAVPQMKGGMSVGVFPEGTRGFSYELRPFKKGPFVLAIAAQAPMVPVVELRFARDPEEGGHPDPSAADRAHLPRADPDRGARRTMSATRSSTASGTRWPTNWRRRASTAAALRWSRAT